MNIFRYHDKLIARASYSVAAMFIFYISLAMLSIQAKRKREKLKQADPGSLAPRRKYGLTKSITGILHAALEPLVEFCAGCMRSLHSEDIVSFVKTDDAPAAKLVKFSLGMTVVVLMIFTFIYKDSSVFNITGYALVDDFLFALPYFSFFLATSLIDYPGIRLFGGKGSFGQTAITSCYTGFSFCPMMIIMAIAMHIAFWDPSVVGKESPRPDSISKIIMYSIGILIWCFQIKSLATLHEISTGKVYLARILGYLALGGIAFALLEIFKSQ